MQRSKREQEFNTAESRDVVDIIDAEEVVAKSYVEYSKYVAKTRAYPSLLDGMKTIYRRMIYASRGYKNLVKSSAIVGETAKLHPHGIDYGVLVTMTSKYGKFPLYTGKGNFGGGGFEASAQRYTSATLNDIARLMYLDLVEYAEYEMGDSGFEEPKYLPALLPYAMIAGSAGMSVGLPTTNIPPLNVMQLIDYYVDALNKVPESDRKVPLPDFGGVILDGEPSHYEEVVRTGYGRMWFKPIINNEAEGVYVVTEVPEYVSIDRLLRRLDYYIENDIVYFTDESDESPRYVFETVDFGKMPPEDLRAEIDSALSCSKTFNNYFEHNGRVYSCGLDHVVNTNIKYLKECVVRKFEDKLYKLENKSQILLAIKDLKESGELKDIDKKTTDYYKGIITDMGYSESTARGVMARSISYLTKSHDDELDQIKEDRELYQSMIKKPELYLLDRYDELRDMIKDFYDSRNHSVFYVDGDIETDNQASLVGNKLVFSSEEDGFDGIEWKYQIVAVTDKGTFNVVNVSRANTDDIVLDEIPGETYVGIMSDITKLYYVYMNDGAVSFIPKERVSVGIGTYLRLREGQSVVGCYSSEKPKIKVTDVSGNWEKIDNPEDWVKSRVSYGSYVMSEEVAYIEGRLR